MKSLLYPATLLLAPLWVSAQTVNSWNNSTGGNWDDAQSWSLGTAPNSSQAASFPSGNGRVVEINSQTSQNNPQSMSVSSISMTGGNTLSLNDAGTNVALSAGAISIEAEGQSAASLQQTGSILSVADTFYLAGSTYMYPWPCTPASYTIQNGAMSAGSLVLDGTYGNCDVTVSNSLVSIEGDLDVVGLTWAPSQLTLTSGTVACDNVVNAAGTMSITQTGGALVVSNLLAFDGYYPRPYGSTYLHAVYSFAGGMLEASNIQIDAEMNIASAAQAGRIANAGYFRLSGILDIGNADEQLGAFILATTTNCQINSFGTVLSTPVCTNATINFTGSATTLAFANSSGEIWSNGTALIVNNWSGSLLGGGREQLKFGTDSTGLSAAQLAQIQFVNPAGLPSATYAAELLPTGEVVPYAPHWLQMIPQGNAIVLYWQPGSVLQTSTSVTGPYADMPGVTAPYTNLLESPQRFFHVRPANSSDLAHN